MATPTANDVSGKKKGRFRRACTRVICAFGGALLVFSVSAVASQGLLGSIQGLIDYFVPTVFAVLFGGFVFLVTAQVWKLIRRFWAKRYSSTPRSAVVFGVCLAIVALVLFEGLLANLRVSGSARSVVQVVLVLLTSIAAVEAEAFFVGLSEPSPSKDRHPLVALLLASSEYAQKKASLATLSTTTLPPLYHRIGKRVAKLEKVPSDLADAVAKIRRLEESLAAGGAAATEAGAEQIDAKPTGFAGKMVGNVKSAAKQSSDRVQLNAAYMSLGRQAVEKYGEKAAPKELREELSVALQKSKALQEEVDALGKSASLGFWTPGRVAFGGIAVAVLLLFGVVRTLSGGASRNYGGSSTQAATTRSSSNDSSRTAVSNSRTNDVDPGVAFMQVLMGMAAQQQAAQRAGAAPSAAGPTVVCPGCAGTGKQSNGYQQCSMCWGKGVMQAGRPYAPQW